MLCVVFRGVCLIRDRANGPCVTAVAGLAFSHDASRAGPEPFLVVEGLLVLPRAMGAGPATG